VDDLRRFRSGTHIRVLTPGSSAGEPLHILSSLERRNSDWDSDPEAGRAALSAAISLVLRLLGKDPDPARSREHVLLSILAERRLVQKQTAELGSLLDAVLNPPLERIGAMATDDFLSLKDRRHLAAALNTLLAFASWRQGVSLNIREWLTPKDGRTPALSSAWRTSMTMKRPSSLASCSKRFSPTPSHSEPTPVWRTPRKGLFSSEFRQCSKENHTPIHSRKTPYAD
jgi:hypothetical protein